MPEQRTITVYRFDELAPDVQTKVIDDARTLATENFDPADLDPVIDDADTIAALLGLTIDRQPDQSPAVYWSGFYSQGAGACCTGTYRYTPGTYARIAAHCPTDPTLHEIARQLDLLHAASIDGGAITATLTQRSGSRYSHENTIEIDVFATDGDGDDVYLDEENQTGALVRVALRRFMRWIYRQLETEYEHLTSAECIRERLTEIETDARYTIDGESSVRL